MTASVAVVIFGNIGQFWPIYRTIFIFFPTLTKKTETIFTIFSHDVEQLVQLLMCIFAMAICHSVSERQSDKCRG